MAVTAKGARGERPFTALLANARQHRPTWWLALAVAAVGLLNFAVLVAQIRALIRALYVNADHAVAMVQAALASPIPARHVVYMSHHLWLEPWWFMRATAASPGYRTLWELAPFVFGLLAIVVVTACAWWALGRVAALLCGAALLATNELVRGTLFVPESHAPVALHVGAFGAALLIAHRLLSGETRRGWLLILSLPFVAFTAAGITDPLLLTSGLAPFVLAPLVCWLRSRSTIWRNVSMFALVTAAISVLLSLLITWVMRHYYHVAVTSFPVHVVAPTAILTSLKNVVTATAELGASGFSSTSSLSTFAAGALTLLAVTALLRALWRWARLPVTSSRDDGENVRDLYVAYWGLVLVAVIAVYALTTVSKESVSRYLIGAWAAVGALLGILATARRTRIATLVAVSLFGLLNLRSELQAPPSEGGPDRALAATVERFVRFHHASIGYAGYWDAAPITWATHLRVRVFPLSPCALRGGRLCVGLLPRINTWYSPRPNVRSFLITDTRPKVPLAVVAPPPAFGRPLARQTVGAGFTVYVYGHDVAGNSIVCEECPIQYWGAQTPQ